MKIAIAELMLDVSCENHSIGGCRGIVDALSFNVAHGGTPYPLQ
jgi:hypothetical protein